MQPKGPSSAAYGSVHRHRHRPAPLVPLQLPFPWSILELLQLGDGHPPSPDGGFFPPSLSRPGQQCGTVAAEPAGSTHRGREAGKLQLAAASYWEFPLLAPTQPFAQGAFTRPPSTAMPHTHSSQSILTG